MQRRITCPLCNGGTHRLFAKHSYWIRACGGCGHRHAELEAPPDHVRRVYDDGYFFGGGAGYPDYLTEGRILRAQGRRYARLLSRYAEPGTVLDVGCAAGFQLAGMLDGGWQGTGLEPNPRMSQFARDELSLEVHNCGLEEFDGTDRYDAVSLIQVVAHFVDPKAALAAAISLLRPGGHLLIETWDRESRTARWFGKHWHEYSPPSVLHWFSRAGLRALVEGFGMTAVASGRPVKWLSGGHAKSLLRHKFEDLPFGKLASGMVGTLPSRIAMPYPAEDVFWALFQRT